MSNIDRLALAVYGCRVIHDLEHATPMWPSVLPRMHDAAQCGGNPSSLHALGRHARRFVDEATAALRDLLDLPDADVVFTASLEEAQALADSAPNANSHLVCSHLIGGPPGVAALLVNKGTSLLPLWGGGGQQNGARGGTQPIALIAGFGEAARRLAAELALMNAQGIP
jgi:cysteine sulfinate desulfinase/cysteine desulfurase-like protein